MIFKCVYDCHKFTIRYWMVLFDEVCVIFFDRFKKYIKWMHLVVRNNVVDVLRGGII